jgi:hypothetical protein
MKHVDLRERDPRTIWYENANVSKEPVEDLGK